MAPTDGNQTARRHVFVAGVTDHGGILIKQMVLPQNRVDFGRSFGLFFLVHPYAETVESKPLRHPVYSGKKGRVAHRISKGEFLRANDRLQYRGTLLCA